MPAEDMENRRRWERAFGVNLGYIYDRYEQYVDDPDSAEPELRTLFEQWGPPPSVDHGHQPVRDRKRERGSPQTSAYQMEKAVAAMQLAQHIRTYGHLEAKIDPLHEGETEHVSLLDPSAYGLTEEDLRALPAAAVWPEAPDRMETAWDALNHLKQVYTESLAYQFTHVHDPEERKWLCRWVETGRAHETLTGEEKVALLNRLIEVEVFEQFLHRKFVGQKRFSIEGLDALVPMLDELISQGVHSGIEHVMIGMAHRGRLNVLAHVLGKPYELIFSEFHHSPNKDLVPSEGSVGINYGWTGDVKYHLGGKRAIREDNVVWTRLTLANNPSHLEFVNPVVEGFTRAAQEERTKRGYPEQDVNKAFAILIHGDAAFPGEGIVAETLNLSQLRGYHTGGTIHIIANNRLGFTTEERDARSTKYASDLAKGFEIPIVHVNADDPEACLAAVRLAYAYRQRFHKDFLIDLIGYRRFGHNEADDPAVTQPKMYAKIQHHPSVRVQYAQTLIKEGLVTEDLIKAKENKAVERLEAAYQRAKYKKEAEPLDLDPPEVLSGSLPDINTSVPLDTLRTINRDLLNWPEGFTVYPKLRRILERRANALADDGKVDWALAETLAFATILHDGIPIRLTGQDTERGTFAHRHLVLHDSKTGESLSPLHVIPQARASFAIYNSPLTETAVLGFEYGYSVFTQDTLVLWEAQFGDFANVAQVIVDQFISAGRAKWGERSNLVMLLPHGYEGQGPEHSSARLERFLQLAAENNWFVANVTKAAQYFHLLRRQALLSGREEERPLVIMTPKSLIRNPRAASLPKFFSGGRFYPVLEQPGLGQRPDRVERLILCSGKIAVELEEKLEKAEDNMDWLHIVRVEELYPFPKQDIQKIIQRYQGLQEIVWVQEEPRNMGAWRYMEPHLLELAGEIPVLYIGRPDRSSTSEGLHEAHKKEQERIVQQALKR
ncbi:2-oxoglutarate dehydrogenase E1 component [Caldalkalibacillus uzonensis]|uniref:2-oxoglutarate dehydrogenase E1 component n=1 Tax=Caldalkalibacillus uzonensis TaxID=353224 RepID=A0ABU0CQZ3_9BACI|nr:2-oxoglutarate dehydrogenase E1 component [Caldalkalibacillus uzonensis]MDQ0337920.1 2-oxoglutarate dehydrogenase E1 component [Caldalkalibacillus uzonensis]